MENRHCRGFRVGPLRILKPVLEEWLKLMEGRYLGSKDAPWWYNERALISQFAGAVWKCRGWALEEYTTSKKKKQERRKSRLSFSGRGDIEFHLRSFKFQAEVKVCNPSLTRGLEEARNKIQETLTEVRNAVRQLTPYQGYRTVGILFVSPCLVKSRKGECQTRIVDLVKYLEGLKNIARAWAFPPLGVRLEADNYIYPGIIMLVKPLGKWRRNLGSEDSY